MPRRPALSPSRLPFARGLRAVLGVAALTGGVVPVLAGAEPAFHLRYHPLGGCPTEADFVAEVRQRAGRVRLAPPQEQASLYDVTFRADGDLVRGKLRVERPGGAVFVREVLGDSCGQAAAALAFVTAVSLDPDAALGGVPAASSAPLGLPPGPSSAPPRTLLAVGVEGATTEAIAPGLASGAGVFVDATFPRLSVQPSVRLGGTWLASGTLGVNDPSAPAGARASFRLLAARIEGCPAALVLEPLRLVPCLGYELGSLYAQGVGVDHPVGAGRLWSAAQVGARAQGRLGGGWFAELGGQMVVPLTDRRFFFDSPRSGFFSIPRLGVAGEVALGVTFW